MNYTQRTTFLAIFVTAAFMASCNLNSSDGTSEEVNSISDLPSCGETQGTSASDMNGTKIFVKDEEATYTCNDSSWVLESVSTIEKLPPCTDKGDKPTLDISVYVTADSAYYRCFSTGWRFIVNPEEDSANEPTPALENSLLKGYISVIGPYVAGTTVTLADVYRDAASDSIRVSDTTYTGTVSMKLGGFIVPKVSSYSDYMILKVKGSFMDPLTGKNSKNPLELEALVNIHDDDIYVDIADFLVYKRIMNLIKGGYQIYDAITQANNELYDAFGFANVDNRESANLAIGLLLRSNLDEKDFAKLVNDFANDFAKDGLYSNKNKLAELGDFAFNIENMKLKNEKTGEVILKESDYRKNLEAFGLTESAAFEEYFTNFWVASYGLGGCAGSRQDAVVKNANKGSDSVAAYFTCDNSAWREATDFERDTVFLGNVPDGTLKSGNVNSEKTYVFDTTGMGTGTPNRWKEPDSIVLVIGSACTDDEKVRFTVKQTKDENGNDVYYACVDRNWVPASETAFRIGRECSKFDKNVVEKYDNADKNEEYARCHETEIPLDEGDPMYSYNWIPTDNVNYKFREKECALNDVFEYNGKYYVCDDDININFREVTNDSEKELGICSESVKGTFGTYKADKTNVYMVCLEDPYTNKWNWEATDKVSYDSKKLCSEETIGETATSDEVYYTCGCMAWDYDVTPAVEKLETDAYECNGHTIEWQKD